MNWETIKFIYRQVLVHNNKIEHLGGDRFKLIYYYPSGEKRWEAEYENGEPHGKFIMWKKSGNIHYEAEYKDGRCIK